MKPKPTTPRKPNDAMRQALQTILDAVDYTVGNCRPNEMVGAVLPVELIKQAKESLQ